MKLTPATAADTIITWMERFELNELKIEKQTHLIDDVLLAICHQVDSERSQGNVRLARRKLALATAAIGSILTKEEKAQKPGNHKQQQRIGGPIFEQAKDETKKKEQEDEREKVECSEKKNHRQYDKDEEGRPNEEAERDKKVATYSEAVVNLYAGALDLTRGFGNDALRRFQFSAKCFKDLERQRAEGITWAAIALTHAECEKQEDAIEAFRKSLAAIDRIPSSDFSAKELRRQILYTVQDTLAYCGMNGSERLPTGLGSMKTNEQ
jgi:hypothetical protein